MLDQLFDELARHGSHLSASQLDTIRLRLADLVNYQAVVGVLGKSGVGKSTLCNALFGRDVVEVDAVWGCTRCPQEINLAYRDGRGLSLIDVPGLGESEAKDAEYRVLYSRLLPELDLVLWLVKADDRALGIDLAFYQRVLQPHLAERGLPLVFVISHADKIDPCEEWDRLHVQPGVGQARHLAAKREQLARLFQHPLPRICVVSATTGYGLVPLMETLIRALPPARQWSLAREARPEHVSPQARRESEQGLWDGIKALFRELVEEGTAWLGQVLARLGQRFF
ncbi:GTPase [Chitiniphilus shinanonensis]|uniref:GTPase n=1 Tax=Chitiniphilus shinanonensis TaxID=553088 RepID=UPI00302DF445